MSNRKFHMTIIQVTVLSEYPYEGGSLSQIDHDITEGDCSGAHEVISQLELTGKEMAEALMKQASDPGFFRLTPEGEDVTDE